MSGKSTSPLTDYLFYKAGQSGIPLSGTFELTPFCNFSCPMCYVRKTAEEVKSSGRSLRTYEQWLKLAREARDAGMLYLLITGGEPTAWPEFWPMGWEGSFSWASGAAQPPSSWPPGRCSASSRWQFIP